MVGMTTMVENLRSSLQEVFCKKQNSQENTCVRVSFLIKLYVLSLQQALQLKKRE